MKMANKDKFWVKKPIFSIIGGVLGIFAVFQFFGGNLFSVGEFVLGLGLFWASFPLWHFGAIATPFGDFGPFCQILPLFGRSGPIQVILGQFWAIFAP